MYLIGYVVEVCWGIKDDGVIFCQFLWCGDGCVLCFFVCFGECFSLYGFWYVFYNYFNVVYLVCFIGDGVSYGFNVFIYGIIKYQNFSYFYYFLVVL